MTNLEKLRQAFAEGLGTDVAQITDTLAYGDPGWDSVAHMAVVAAIEREFDIMLETADVISMSSFSKGREIVAKYGISFDVGG